CMFSGLVGTSTSGAYIESSTGIREGARTGLASVVTAALFLLSLFFIPLFEPLQSLRYAYAPPLLVVGEDRLRRLHGARAGVRHDRGDGVHVQHRQRTDGGAAALSGHEAARRT